MEPISGKVFGEALCNTIYTMTGFNITKQDSPLDEQLADNRKIAGVMAILGKKNHLLMVSGDKKTLETLVSYMTGIDISELKDEDLYDGITEFANMTSGLAKEAFMGTEYEYNLTTAFAIIGDNIKIITKKSISRFKQSFGEGKIKLTLEIFNF